MNLQRDIQVSGSAKYLDYLTITSSSAIMMATSSAIPQAGVVLQVEKIELPELVRDQDAAGAEDVIFVANP